MAKKDNQALNQRKFLPIYGTFKELLSENRGIFKLVRKAKNPGILKAIWHARDGEILALQSANQKQTTRVQEKISEIENLKQSHEWDEMGWFEQRAHLQHEIDSLKELITKKDDTVAIRNEEIKSLREFILKLQDKISFQISEKEKLKEQLLRFQGLSKNLEAAFEMGRTELEKNRKDQTRLKDSLNLSHYSLLSLDHEVDKQSEEIVSLEQEVSMWKLRYEDLLDQMKNSEQKIRQYQRINKNMENELFKVNQRLEESRYN